MTRSGAAQGAIDGAIAAATSSDPEQPSPASAAPPKKWVSAVTSRVSTKWFGGAATVLILGATAGFGGLGAVPEPPLPELGPGDTFTGAGMEMTPQRAVLIDELGEAGIRVEEGQRVLAVIMDVTNIDDAARPSTGDGGITEIRIEGAPDVAPSVARYDDTTLSPWLQPGVTAPLVLAWAVPADAFAEGDDLRVALHTATEFTGEYFVYGDYWDDVEVAAHASLPIEDVGAGVTE